MFIPQHRPVSRTYRHIGRYRQILTVLFNKVSVISLTGQCGRYLEIGAQILARDGRNLLRPIRDMSHQDGFRGTRPYFIRWPDTVDEAGPYPVTLAEELSKLQDSVPPFPFGQVKDLIEAELDAGISDIFMSIEETPLAAASIAQVHRARLLSGREVVVKVRRPGIERTVSIDLEILLHLAGLAERHVPELGFYQPTRIVEEFARVIDRKWIFLWKRIHGAFARQFAETRPSFRSFSGNFPRRAS